ncbi:MAG: N-acetylglucosamine kinase [Candidatus Acidiferrales bacterium]
MPQKKSAVKRKLLLAVDSGATHTRAIVATPEGLILGSGHAGPGNSYAVGKRLALQNLRGAIVMALRAAQVKPRHIAVAAVGSASVRADGKGAAEIKKKLRPIFATSRLLVVADARIAVEGALAGGAGVVIVCGTGSIVLAKDSLCRIFRVGGWGYLIGDEGSAQWTGREAVRRAAYAADKTGRATTLLAMVQRHFQLPAFDRLIDVIYKNRMTPADWGKLSPLVSSAALAGDHVAREILKEGATALAAQAARAVQRIRRESVLVSIQGSMFLIGPLFLNPLRAALKELAPEARLVTPILSPLGGAFLMALGNAGISVTRVKLAGFRRIFHA